MTGLLFVLLVAATTGDSPSKACLSCHQTTSVPAIEEHDGHPIAVEYNMARAFAAGKLKAVQAPSGFGSTIAKDLLVEGRVECTSCHVTHAEESAQAHRLRLPVRANPGDPLNPNPAQLCLACHELE